MTIASRKLGDIKIIIMHCSDSDRIEDDDISVIRGWHIKQGWEDVGYHYFVTKRGEVQKGRYITRVGAHCKGFNYDSIGICLSGKKDFKEIQFKAVAILIDNLTSICHNIRVKYGIVPHRLFNNQKTCPNYQILNVWGKTNKKISALDIDKDGKLIHLIDKTKLKGKVMNEIGIKGIESVIKVGNDLCDSILSHREKKEPWGALDLLEDVGPDAVAAVSNLSSIPDEIKDLSKEELIKVVTELSLLVVKTITVTVGYMP